MKKLVNFLFVVTLFILSAGCAATLPTNSYTPQNFVRINGKVDMGTFTYEPFEQSKVKKPNQIQTTAAGQLYISTNVADFVKRGTALELEKSGIALDPSAPIKLDGNVLEFKADDLGYSVDWIYRIKYTLIQRDNSKVLFSETFAPAPKKGGKFQQPIDYANVVNEMILGGYDLFIRNPSVKSILAGSNTPPLPTPISK